MSIIFCSDVLGLKDSRLKLYVKYPELLREPSEKTKLLLLSKKNLMYLETLLVSFGIIAQ